MTSSISARASLQPSSGASDPTAALLELIEQQQLKAHFQPIVDLRAASLFGHEALIRGPKDSALAMPKALFEAARAARIVTTLEFECVRTALAQWAICAAGGKLFVNLSASALTLALSGTRLATSLSFLADCGVPASALVVELAEHEQVEDIATLHGIVDLLRLRGVQIALDDFGDGRSSLRLWSELRPDYVKIDRYFTQGLAEDPNKLQTFRAMLQIAETFGARLIAEGIETEAELRVLRDLEVHYGQGWYVGLPEVLPMQELPHEPRQVLRSRDVAVLPELCTTGGRSVGAAKLLIEAPTVTAATTNDELFTMLAGYAGLHAIAVLREERPIGLIDCLQFMNQYARPFFRELHGRKSCLMSANRRPIRLEIRAGVAEMMDLLTADDHRYLREGIILTDEGRYRGLATGQALVKAVMAARVEVARHANPLTFLPGNIPTTRHIERLLAAGTTFAVAHADLNHFKPYNDYYGYWRGDEMIRLAAAVLSRGCDAKRDFLGHIGGDDFVVVFQSADCEGRCQQMIQRFNQRALELFDPEARSAGGIVAPDRQGGERFHPCTTLSVGIACVTPELYRLADEVSAAASTAKREAKACASGFFTCAAVPSAPRRASQAL